MSSRAPVPDRIGQHYRVEALLGSGGTSRVLQVVDVRDGRRLALKQARAEGAAARARSDALFRQEFHVLSRIAHPNVVRVFEYGVDDGRPFYTMELLAGRALNEVTPLPWRRLCAILRELCAPLSLLHARRFVHCDVTARNVLVTEDGQTKLIDFGALTALDRAATTIAGTPPHMAPELVRKQSIDGRVDMFALGALAYSLLAGRHAYPARSIAELPQVWAVAPPSLGELELDVPAALDQLVMSLLSLDVSARPLQLAELVRKLSAILDDGAAAKTDSLQAQLATPRLVGRDAPLDQFRQALQSAALGRGSVLCIAGEPGMGKSRMLEACALEAIHTGCLVVQVAAEEAADEPCALIARMLLTACAAQPGLAEQLPTGVRDLVGSQPDAASLLARELATQSQSERQRCFAALGLQRTAVVLLDDLTRADVTSIQSCLALSAAAEHMSLLLVASIGAGSTGLDRDVAALVSRSRTLELQPLAEHETEQLLRSVLGDAAHLESLLAWVQRAALGVPGASIELLRHAVQEGYVRFADGQFWVGEALYTGRAELPRAQSEAVERSIAGLSPGAREALAVLSLLTPFGTLAATEQVELLCSGGWSHHEALDALDELCDAQLIALVADGYALRFEEITRRTCAALPRELLRRWQRQLGAYYGQRGHDFRMLSALHYDHAGERETALRKLIALDAELRGPDDPNIKLGGSALGLALHERMLQHVLATGAPRCEVIHFRRLLVSIGSTADPRYGREGPAVLDALCDDVGLGFWDAADPALSDHERLLSCLTRAQERFTHATPGERLSPLDAIRRLAEVAVALSSIAGTTFEAATANRLVQRFRPLRTLAPVLDLTYRMIEATARAVSCGSRELERWRGLLETLQVRPDGLTELIWRYMQSGMHYNMGRELAQLGDEAALAHAQVLAMQQRTQMQACSVRLLHALAQGDHHTAAEQRRLRAIAALASRHEDQRLTSSYMAEVTLLDACADLHELQLLAAWFEAKAEHLPGLRPAAAYARACSLVQSGQTAQAESLVEAQLIAALPLQHPVWYSLRGLRAEIALLRGEPDLARQLALQAIRTAAEAGLDMRPDTRAERVLALALARCGDTAAALAEIDRLLESLGDGAAAHSVRAGQLHETRARIALLAEDLELFWQSHARVQACYGRHEHPGLVRRLQRLTSASTQSTKRAPGTAGSQQTLSTLRTDLERLGRREQHGHLLQLLLHDAGARAGYLYAVQARSPARCLATQATAPSDAALDAQVRAYVERLVAWQDEQTQSVSQDTELAIRHGSSGEDMLSALPLRSLDGTLQGLLLLYVAPGTLAELRTEGLRLIAGELLRELEP